MGRRMKKVENDCLTQYTMSTGKSGMES